MTAAHVIETSWVVDSFRCPVASFRHDARSCSSVCTGRVRDGCEAVPFMEWRVGNGKSMERWYYFFRRKIQSYRAIGETFYLDDWHLAK